MSILLNLLWLFLGGWATAVSWFFASLVMLISIIGIPWAKACFNIAILNLWPFGSKVEKSKSSAVMSGLSTLGNIVWFVLCGWWLGLGHLLLGLFLCLTIIGIPFGLQHFKLAGLSLSPVGRSINLDL